MSSVSEPGRVISSGGAAVSGPSQQACGTLMSLKSSGQVGETGSGWSVDIYGLCNKKPDITKPGCWQAETC